MNKQLSKEKASAKENWDSAQAAYTRLWEVDDQLTEAKKYEERYDELREELGREAWRWKVQT